jgi:hypothetical protein
MPQSEYGIYKVFADGKSVWVENAYSLQRARSRVDELALKYSASFAVYDLRSPARPVFEVKK